jgi:predicted Fe-Mo cluster-binding NifX family protein
MIVAIPTLEGRVSPLFDVARCGIVVDLDGEREVRRQTLALHSPDLTRRVAALTEQAVDVLICGAVSRPLEALLSAAGVRVISQTCGPVEDVLRGFIAGRLSDGAFLMPVVVAAGGNVAAAGPVCSAAWVVPGAVGRGAEMRMEQDQRRPGHRTRKCKGETNAWWRSHGTARKRSKDGSRRRLLCRFQNAGVHEPPSRPRALGRGSQRTSEWWRPRLAAPLLRYRSDGLAARRGPRLPRSSVLSGRRPAGAAARAADRCPAGRPAMPGEQRRATPAAHRRPGGDTSRYGEHVALLRLG